MGNKLGQRRQVVDEKYTRPQGLYQHKDVDQKKLRKLIFDSKLAPCYLADEECGYDLEECPIYILDNKDLYAEEAPTQRERERQRMLAIPGLIAPNEIQDEMVDS